MPRPSRKLAAGQHVDLRRLLREQSGLPLAGDHDAGDELETGRDAGEVAVEDQDLVEHVLRAIRADEVRVTRVVGSEHMVIRK